MMLFSLLLAAACAFNDAELYPNDTVTANVTGVLFGCGANTDPDFVVPHLFATFRKADGTKKEYCIYGVNHKGTFLVNLRLSPEQRKELGPDATFTGMRLDGGKPETNARIRITDAKAFKEVLKPLDITVTPRAQLPFPNRPNTIVPQTAEPAANDLKARWPVKLPPCCTVTSRRVGKSLVVDITAPAGSVTEIPLGTACEAKKVKSFFVPYLTWGERDGRVLADLLEGGWFRLAEFDWYVSNASDVYARETPGGRELVARYRPDTAGNLKPVRERVVITLSRDFDEILPEIPNPKSPWKHVCGSHVWRSHPSFDRANDTALWRAAKKAGFRHLAVTDHETQWRDNGEPFTFCTVAAAGKGGDAAQRAYTKVMIDELGYRYGPYNNFTDLSTQSDFFNRDAVTRRPDGSLHTAWMRCYAPKPVLMPAACDRFAGELRRKFGFNTAYCDVHTSMLPWQRTDYDHRVPGAATYAQTFYSWGETLLKQKRHWNGPVYSEGAHQFVWAGLADGSYAQDRSYRFRTEPWLVDFELLRTQKLATDFGMGGLGMFSPPATDLERMYYTPSAPKGRDELIDRFLAATIAFGHSGMIVCDGCWDPPNGFGPAYARPTKAVWQERGFPAEMYRSYFMIQALAAAYTASEAVSIRYVGADGRFRTTSEALIDGSIALNAIVTHYANGTVTVVNGSDARTLAVTVDGRSLTLGPNGFAGWGKGVEVLSTDVNGKRVHTAKGPEYAYREVEGEKPVVTLLDDPAEATVRIECERFADFGGWKHDAQFMDEMGSPYLLAHGLGVPVADAKTTFTVARAGTYAAWVRTKNWTAPWSAAAGAGVFRIIVNGAELPMTLGVQGTGDWLWTKAGEVALKAGANTLALHDLTGFDGRCDAVCFTMGTETPADPRTARRPVPEEIVTSDLTVVGGGIAGICTALSAARLGLKVALVQDRPMLGGANSSEVRVHLGGYQNLGPYPRLGDVVSEIGPARGGNAQPAARYEDDRKLAAVRAEPNIRLFLNTRVNAVGTNAWRRIVSADGCDTVSGRVTRFVSPLYADCTGDASVGFLAGAAYRLGRESRAETGESMAPDRADAMTLGASVQWYAKHVKEGAAPTFPERPWMIAFNEKNCEYNMRGDWDWETGMLRDQLNGFERVRDYGLLVVYSNWSYIKNRGARKAAFADAALDWVAHVAGKRETRRLMGDHVLCQQDVFEERPHPDGTCCTTWAIDLHFPMPANARHFDGEPFRSICTHNRHYAYPIPYRCLYSRNVDNLFMAGRDISVTHVALGTTRVMRTHGMQGEVVGMAASVCRRYGCLPRGVYAAHLDDLRALMTRGVGKGTLQPPQTYNLGALKKRGGTSPVRLRKNDCVLLIGDSITEQGVRTLPNGYYHQLTNTAAQVATDLNLTFVGAGASGSRLPDWEEWLERSRTKDVLICGRMVNLKDVFARHADVVVVFLGQNDITRPNVSDSEESMADWIRHTETFVARVMARVGARDAVLATITPCGTDPRSARNTGRRELNRRLKELAEQKGWGLADYGARLDALGRQVARGTAYNLIPDFVHPSPHRLGHTALAATLSAALGETRMATALEARLAHEIETHLHGTTPLLSVNATVDPARSADDREFEWTCRWRWTDAAKTPVCRRDTPTVSVTLPEGWKVVSSTERRAAEGVMVIRGCPDRLVNDLTFAATCGNGRKDAYKLMIPPPWRVAGGFSGDDRWTRSGYQADVAPSALERALAAGKSWSDSFTVGGVDCRWHAFLLTTDYMGFRARGTVNPEQFLFGTQNEVVYALRRITCDRPRTLRTTLSFAGWCGTRGYRIWFNGEEVFAGMQKGRSMSGPTLRFKAGENILFIRSDHNAWQRDFALDFVPEPGDDLADLRFDWR